MKCPLNYLFPFQLIFLVFVITYRNKIWEKKKTRSKVAKKVVHLQCWKLALTHSQMWVWKELHEYWSVDHCDCGLQYEIEDSITFRFLVMCFSLLGGLLISWKINPINCISIIQLCNSFANKNKTHESVHIILFHQWWLKSSTLHHTVKWNLNQSTYLFNIISKNNSMRNKNGKKLTLSPFPWSLEVSALSLSSLSSILCQLKQANWLAFNTIKDNKNKRTCNTVNANQTCSSQTQLNTVYCSSGFRFYFIFSIEWLYWNNLWEIFWNALWLNQNSIFVKLICILYFSFFTLVPYIFPHFLGWVPFPFTACIIWEKYNKIASDYKCSCMLHHFIF